MDSIIHSFLGPLLLTGGNFTVITSWSLCHKTLPGRCSGVKKKPCRWLIFKEHNNTSINATRQLWTHVCLNMTGVRLWFPRGATADAGGDEQRGEEERNPSGLNFLELPGVLTASSESRLRFGDFPSILDGVVTGAVLGLAGWDDASALLGFFADGAFIRSWKKCLLVWVWCFGSLDSSASCQSCFLISVFAVGFSSSKLTSWSKAISLASSSKMTFFTLWGNGCLNSFVFSRSCSSHFLPVAGRLFFLHSSLSLGTVKLLRVSSSISMFSLKSWQQFST